MSALPKVEGYAVVERIGSGSYATVYKAFKNVGRREVVAIKCVDKSKLCGSAVDNIVTEISLLKVLKHQHIVEMKEFQWDERFIYIIMEYCDGGDLSCFIRKRRKLPESVCKTFLQQLALALQFLRSRNVCHMDLKPQNLLLSCSPILTLKLGDFGFAQYLSTADENSSLRGSPLYMAPEMLFKKKYDARVDLWSVGIIMFECLFGRAPYSSSNFQELATKIRSQAPIEIPAGSNISSECRDLLTSLLKHNPDERIDYETFFQHPFLDLEHSPSPDAYQKAVHLVTKAVKHDADQHYVEALHFYSEALRYFVPLIHAEWDEKKKAAMRLRVNDYIKRAEDLKKIVFPADKDQELQPSPTCSTNFQELRRQCTATPAMGTALDIGATAELFLAERNYQLALDNFQSCLGILVPLLATEPKGPRRDVLHMQVEYWLKQAESLKAILSFEKLNRNSTNQEHTDGCSIQ